MQPISPIKMAMQPKASPPRRPASSSKLAFGKTPLQGLAPSQHFCAPALARLFIPLLGILASEYLFGLGKRIFFGGGGKKDNNQHPPQQGPYPPNQGGGNPPYTHWNPPAPPPPGGRPPYQ